MTSNPYSTNPSLSPFSTNSPPHRRPSYATVAAGTTASVHPSRFNTLSAAVPSTTQTMPMSQQLRQPQLTKQRSRSSMKGIEMDGQGGHQSWKRPSSSWSNDFARLDGNVGCPHHDRHPPFFTPSYLRYSRHVQRLNQAWDAHLAELQENIHLIPPRQLSIATSPSNANLGKMHPSHISRGVVQDVIERIPPPPEEDKSHPLPSRFSDIDKHSNGLEVLVDGSEVRFTGTTKSQDDAASVRADHAMPRECGIYYYEITVLSRGHDTFIGVGFSGRKVNLSRLPGWEADSWAYHGDDGFSFACTPNGKAYGPKFGAQDVVGCGFNFRTGNVFFTRNGTHLGNAFSGIKGDRLYPSVGMKKGGDHIRVNFGQSPFVFDIDRMMDAERSRTMSDITTVDVQNLHPPDSESDLIHNLIGQYLAHEGYIGTAKAFAEDVNEQQQSLSSDAKLLHLPNAEDDVHAANRQKIRKAILDGDIDKALKFTNCFYPHVLEDDRNRSIHFRLRCRKFIEMTRRCTELSAAASSSPTTVTKSVESLGSNGHTENGGIDVEDIPDQQQEPLDTQMELDDQLHREASKSLIPSEDVDMDASQELPSKLTSLKHDELQTQTIAYGQELQATFGNDSRLQTRKQLNEIFAIMAYTNPSESVVGPLLDPRGRVQIAEDLNSAILVSLGKPSFAALEKLSAQAEALLDEAAAKSGGAAAFVNVQKDLLQGYISTE